MRVETLKTEKVQPFVLRLPAELTIKPKYEIDLPAKCKALVFETTAMRDNYVGKVNKPTKVRALRVIVVNRNGNTPRSMGDYGRYPGDFTSDDMLDVARYIQRVSYGLSKVKRTNEETIDHDE